MSIEVVRISKFFDRPFTYAKGDTFRLGLTFSYDVTNVTFDLKIFPAGSDTPALTFGNIDWVLSGTRKKVLTKTPAAMTISPGKYRMVITHTFSDGTVRKRFDSILTVQE